METDEITLENGVAFSLTEPHSSEAFITVHMGNQAATLSTDAVHKLYQWLHDHRQSFMSFYQKGWNLAKKLREEGPFPQSFYHRLALFNMHCHEIGVGPFYTNEEGPTEQAVNGFYAFIHNDESEAKHHLFET